STWRRTTGPMRIRVTGPLSSSSAILSEVRILDFFKLVVDRGVHGRGGNPTRASAEDIMQRMLLVAWLGLSLPVVVGADDSKSTAGAKPPWQRLLTGDDARKGTELEKRIDELVNADKYVEAMRAGEELFTLRTKVQGTDHWQTVTVKWGLVELKK